MTKFTFTLIFVMLSVFSFAQQTINFLSNTTNSFEVLSKSQTELTVSLNLSEIKTSNLSNNRGEFFRINSDDYTQSHFLGEPELPVLRRLIEVPYNANAKVEIIEFQEQIINLEDYGINARLYPSQPSLSKSQDPSEVEFQMNEETYTSTVFTKYPTVNVEIDGIMRGVRIGRLEIAPIQYNPGTNQLKVYTNIKVKVTFENADIASTNAEKKRLYSPFFQKNFNNFLNYSPAFTKDEITTYPIKYVIVSDPMFETDLQPFIQWKRKKGFTVVEAYTDNASVGSTTTSIKNYLQGLYNGGTAASPAPTFVLFVGDVAQIPTFDGTTDSHKTDLYYCEYTSDFFPEIFYGRFSATNSSQLQAQVNKTLEYEQYQMPNPSYLGKALMVAGVDQEGGDPNGFSSVHGNGQLQYGMNNYFNTAHGITVFEYLYPESDIPANETAIRSDFNTGVCYANYTAHCSSAGWYNPSFETSHVAAMSNTNKYSLMVGNCCQSNTFYDPECFGEAVLRKANAGAIGYIGGSNFSYWDEDYHWGVGAQTIQSSPPPTYSASALGAYDKIFHENGEAFENWYVTNAQIIMGGNMAVQQAGDMKKDYYWEIYHLMGDPSVMTYMGVPTAVVATYTDPLEVGATSLVVNTEIHALVAISKNGTLLDAEYSGTGTSVTLDFPALTTTDPLDIVVTKQFRAPHIETIEVIEAGPIIANFEADVTTVVEGGTVNFTDLSTCETTITSWNWSFTGAATTTSTSQNPTGIQYNTFGDYTVSLTVSDGTNDDTETKTAYIHVISADELYADFTGDPLVVLVGETVNFTDNSNGGVTSWNWTFDGASPGTSAIQHPVNIQYPTLGLYDVTLQVGDGTDTHTTTKTAYIQVVESLIPPVADFMADYTNIMVGGSVNFTDLSANAPTSWNWTFEGADLTFSTDENPAGITYNTAGDFMVKLAVANGLGGDTLIKEAYIHVLADTSFHEAPDIDFTASERLIVMGTSIDFTDLSEDYPISWSWTFTGASTTSSTEQHPTNITYSTPGMYPVTLSATNPQGTGTLTKTDYIIVTDGITDEICDEISNVANGEGSTAQALSSTWGYHPGHNGKYVTAYADRYENYMISEVRSMYVPVFKAIGSGTKVKFRIWDGDTEPVNILGTKEFTVNTLSPIIFNPVIFSTPVPVNGVFWVGFEISYAGADTFATYMAPNRVNPALNTLYCKKDGNWYDAPTLFGNSTSLLWKINGCVVGIDPIIIDEAEINLYPNPTNNILNIDLGFLQVNSFDVAIYDITGRQVNILKNKIFDNQYTIDLSDQQQGLYFVNLIINNRSFTRKVSVIK
ncbi:MAG: PKD domain-containing protein [Bacteroidales bacterium]|nr:PKD domain-containing protein [Bacteroidales bacterium]